RGGAVQEAETEREPGHAHAGDEESGAERVQAPARERGEEADPQEAEPGERGRAARQGAEIEMQAVEVHAPPSSRGEKQASASAAARASTASAQPSMLPCAAGSGVARISLGQSTARSPKPSAATRIAVDARASTH